MADWRETVKMQIVEEGFDVENSEETIEIIGQHYFDMARDDPEDFVELYLNTLAKDNPEELRVLVSDIAEQLGFL